MPIYEYQCTACKHLLEVLQKMSDAPLTDCPSCGKAQLQKKISAVGFRLSGGGWYETDFKSSGHKKNLSGDASATSSTSETSSPKDASPSATKNESASSTTSKSNSSAPSGASSSST